MAKPDQPQPDSESSRYRHLLPRYRRYAPTYDREWGRYSRATLGKVVELLDKHAPDARSLVDVGCGTGLLASMVRPENPDMAITGVDVSEEMLDRARQRFADDARTDWQVASAESLPFDDESFDAAVCANGFHLIVDQESALREFKRVLQPRGTLIIVDWNRAYATIKLLAALYPLVDKHPRRISTRSELAQTVTGVGFLLVDDLSFRATPFWGMSAVIARKQDRAPNAAQDL